MAWLFKQARSKNWFIGWRVGKKLFNRTTRTPDREQAEKQLETYNLMAEANRQKRLTEDFFNSLTGKTAQRVPLRQAAAEFLNARKGKAIGTQIRYKHVLDSFGLYLHSTDAAPLLCDINAEAVQNFLNQVRQRTTSTTANFHRSVLKAFFNHCVDNEKVGSNPVDKIDPFKATKAELEVGRRPFTQDELRRVYKAAPNAFWRFAVAFGVYTGLRLGNVATLRWRDIDLEKQTVTVVDIKDPDPLKIPICSPFLLNTFIDLKRKSPKAKPDDYLFPDYAKLYLTKTKQGDNSSAVLSMEFRAILVSAKLLNDYERKESGSRSCRRAVSPLSFHSLRHNFVTMLQERGASQMVARELVGHDSDAVNNLYTHATPELLRKSLKRLPEMFK